MRAIIDTNLFIARLLWRGSPHVLLDHAHGVHARGMLRFVERDPHVAFAREVVDLVGLHPPDHRLQAEWIDQVAVMQLEWAAAGFRGGPQVIDPLAVQAARPPHEAVHGVALVEQQLGQIRAILPANARDEAVFMPEILSWIVVV